MTNWCMRFEAKHNYFKKLAIGLGNFKNLPWTLAGRHQNKQCYTMHFLHKPIECGPGIVILLFYTLQFNVGTGVCTSCIHWHPPLKNVWQLVYPLKSNSSDRPTSILLHTPKFASPLSKRKKSAFNFYQLLNEIVISCILAL